MSTPVSYEVPLCALSPDAVILSRRDWGMQHECLVAEVTAAPATKARRKVAPEA